MVLITVEICIFLLTLFFLYMVRHFNYWKKRNVPFFEPIPIFGNVLNICRGKESLGEFLGRVYNQTVHPYIGIFIFDEPCLLINDLDLIKDILVKDFGHFANRTIADNEKHDAVGCNMLFLMKTPRWFTMRRKMSLAFSTGKLRMFSDISWKCGENLVKYVEESMSHNNVIEAREMCSKFTVNSITATALGIQDDCFENTNSPFIQIANKTFNWNRFWYTFQVTCYLIAPRIVKFFNMRYIDTDTSNFLRYIFWKSLTERKMSETVGNDLLDILLEMRERDRIYDSKSLEGDILVAQLAQFFLAGYETTSSTMAFALAELALNPEIQTKLRNELSTLKETNTSVSYASINKMKYLQNIILETLRKYPIMPYLDRRCTETYTIPDSNLTLSKGQMIFIPTIGIHYDEKYYPNPEKFDPDRFRVENRETRHNMSFLAFGAGPRNCLGQRLGMLNAKIGLVNLLSNFEVKVCDRTEKKIKLIPKGILLQPENGIYVRFVKLSEK